MKNYHSPLSTIILLMGLISIDVFADEPLESLSKVSLQDAIVLALHSYPCQLSNEGVRLIYPGAYPCMLQEQKKVVTVDENGEQYFFYVRDGKSIHNVVVNAKNGKVSEMLPLSNDSPNEEAHLFADNH